MTLVMYNCQAGSTEGHMRVTREQAAANRQRIVEAASALFRKHGFDGIGVDDITKAAGLTHGGFYGHFKSKDDLAAEACAHEGVDPFGSWTDTAPEKRLDGIVRSYLTARHRDNRSNGCLFAALGSEVVRQPKAVRHAFTERFRSTVDTIVRLIPGRSVTARRERALA